MNWLLCHWGYGLTMREIVLDTETTGISPRWFRIIEIEHWN